MNQIYILVLFLVYSASNTYLNKENSPVSNKEAIHEIEKSLPYFVMEDSCCLNDSLFAQNVRNSLKIKVLDSMCQVNLVVLDLPGCDSVYFIDWGDGELDYGPYSNGIITHTYTQTGDYTIQVPVVEFDAKGDPCFDTLVKFTANLNCTCECSNYSLTVNVNDIQSPVQCGDIFTLACPAPDSLNLTGFFNCVGNACSDAEISWSLTGPDLEHEDFVPTGNFQIKLPPLLNPGLYELNLQSKCGLELCKCSITLYLSPCLIAEACSDFCPGNPWSHFNAALIQDMVVFNGQLIVAGSFFTIGKEELPVNNIAAWDGTTWTALEGGGLNNKVNDLEIHDGLLYAGGEFTLAGNTPADKIAAWDGSSWIGLLHGGINGNFTNVDALLSTSGGLIVGGKFISVGDPALIVSNIAAWNPGLGWARMGSNLDGPVFALSFYQGKIVAGGRFGNIPGGFNNVAWWNGAWNKYGEQGAINIKSNTPHPDDGVHALAVFNDQLIVGGQFTSTMTDSAPNDQRTRHLALWDGTQWSCLGTGKGVNLGNGVYSMQVYGNDLIVGGQFTRINQQPINHLARWDGMNWTGMVHPTTGGIRTLTSYHAPEGLACTLYSGGELGMNQWACSSVAVKTQNQIIRISIYPNPAIDQFFIELHDYPLEHVHVEIYSLLGQKIMDHSFSRNQPGTPGIVKTNGLISGTYLVKVSTVKGSTIRKIIIGD